ncbi:hypothetical protein H0E87_016784 [Populus deltoides]|uniref:Nucleoside phosphorylase domain-containing protein n=1 Tax=Populus deltoides TaxID=3696 RepID=A0A8T2YAP4_POPDE|nr:hypothetical protein H0E87_016784 [Populus deltoides]
MAAKLVTLPYFASQVNSKGPYIGLLTVFPPEENAFLGTADFKPNPEHPFVDLSGRRYRVGTIYGKKVIYVRCGIGMVNAAAVTQQMLDLFDVAGIVHFGISGDINNSMSIGDVSIPKQFANTGLWNWLNPKGTVDPDDVAQLEVGKYNVPKGDGVNLLGKLSYSTEQLFSVSREPNDATTLFWAGVSQHWLKLASSLEGMELEKCVNSSLCLPQKPKLVVGLKGSTADIFVDNAAYRDFLYKAFGVSSADMESSAILAIYSEITRSNRLFHYQLKKLILLLFQTCLSNGIPVIVIRGMSDLAGGQSGENAMDTYGSLAALNTAKAVLKFISKLPGYNSR